MEEVVNQSDNQEQKKSKKKWLILLLLLLLFIAAVVAVVVVVFLSSGNKTPVTSDAAQLSIRTTIQKNGGEESWIQADYKFIELDTSGERVTKPTNLDINAENVVVIEFSVKNMGESNILCAVNLTSLVANNIKVEFFVNDVEDTDATDSVQVQLAKLESSVIKVRLSIEDVSQDAEFSSEILVVLTSI